MTLGETSTSSLIERKSIMGRQSFAVKRGVEPVTRLTVIKFGGKHCFPIALIALSAAKGTMTNTVVYSVRCLLKSQRVSIIWVPLKAESKKNSRVSFFFKFFYMQFFAHMGNIHSHVSPFFRKIA